MGRIRLEAARMLDARPERVWEILSDYRVGHPSILPKAFGPLHVEAGGVGAGTVISFDMRTGGATRHFHGEVSAPEPGRRLVETYSDGAVTTFTITPEDGGQRSEVRITTEIPAPRGPIGWLTSALAPRMLRPIYEEELTNLERVARG